MERGHWMAAVVAALGLAFGGAGCTSNPTPVTDELVRDSDSMTENAKGVRRASDPSPAEVQRKRQKQMREVKREFAFEQFEYGRKELVAKRYSQAVEYLTIAVAADPKEPVYLNDLGRAQYWLQHYREARESLERANLLSGQIHPQTADERRASAQMRAQILCNLGDLARAEQNPDEALRCYRKAGDFDPGLARVQFEIGDLALRRQDYPEAENRFRSTLDLDPGEARAHLGLTLVYHAVGNDEMAWREIQTIEAGGELSVDPDLRAAVLAGRDQQRSNTRRRLANTP